MRHERRRGPHTASLRGFPHVADAAGFLELVEEAFASSRLLPFDERRPRLGLEESAVADFVIVGDEHVEGVVDEVTPKKKRACSGPYAARPR